VIDGFELVHRWASLSQGGRALALTVTLDNHTLLSLLSFMSTLFSTRPFSGFSHRPLLRVLLFLFIIGTFFVVFLPPTYVPRLINVPQYPGHNRPLSFDPPQPGSNRHRIRIQRPITRPDAHRNKDVWARRADAVRDAFLRAYNSYVAYASPYDELLPLSKAPMDTCVFFISRYGRN